MATASLLSSSSKTLSPPSAHPHERASSSSRSDSAISSTSTTRVFPHPHSHITRDERGIGSSSSPLFASLTPASSPGATPIIPARTSSIPSSTSPELDTVGQFTFSNRLPRPQRRASSSRDETDATVRTHPFPSPPKSTTTRRVAARERRVSFEEPSNTMSSHTHSGSSDSEGEEGRRGSFVSVRARARRSPRRVGSKASSTTSDTAASPKSCRTGELVFSQPSVRARTPTSPTSLSTKRSAAPVGAASPQTTRSQSSWPATSPRRPSVDSFFSKDSVSPRSSVVVIKREAAGAKAATWATVPSWRDSLTRDVFPSPSRPLSAALFESSAKTYTPSLGSSGSSDGASSVFAPISTPPRSAKSPSALWSTPSRSSASTMASSLPSPSTPSSSVSTAALLKQAAARDPLPSTASPSTTSSVTAPPRRSSASEAPSRRAGEASPFPPSSKVSPTPSLVSLLSDMSASPNAEVGEVGPDGLLRAKFKTRKYGKAPWEDGNTGDESSTAIDSQAGESPLDELDLMMQAEAKREERSARDRERRRRKMLMLSEEAVMDGVGVMDSVDIGHEAVSPDVLPPSSSLTRNQSVFGAKPRSSRTADAATTSAVGLDATDDFLDSCLAEPQTGSSPRVSLEDSRDRRHSNAFSDVSGISEYFDADESSLSRPLSPEVVDLPLDLVEPEPALDLSRQQTSLWVHDTIAVADRRMSAIGEEEETEVLALEEASTPSAIKPVPDPLNVSRPPLRSQHDSASTITVPISPISTTFNSSSSVMYAHSNTSTTSAANTTTSKSSRSRLAARINLGNIFKRDKTPLAPTKGISPETLGLREAWRAEAEAERALQLASSSDAVVALGVGGVRRPSMHTSGGSSSGGLTDEWGTPTLTSNEEFDSQTGKGAAGGAKNMSIVSSATLTNGAPDKTSTPEGRALATMFEKFAKEEEERLRSIAARRTAVV